MRLSDLPEDILALIFDFPIGHEVLRLWQSGDIKLRSRLSNGGVKSLCLWIFSSKTRYFLPVCVESFKLEKLRISAHPSHYIPRLWLYFRSPAYDILRKLSSRLKHLHLGIQGAGPLLFDPNNWIKDIGSIYYDAISNPDIPLESPSGNAFDADSWNFRHEFGRLETLILGCRSHLSTHTPVLSNKLPESLTHLDIRDEVFDFELEDLFHPNLTSIALPCDSITEELIHFIPPYITDMLDCSDQFTERAFIKLLIDHSTGDRKLLPNLVKFPYNGSLGSASWYNYFFNDDSDMEEDEQRYEGLALTRLPDSIRHLSFFDGALPRCDLPLPSSLTSLSCIFFPRRVTAGITSQWLPRGLTRLDCSSQAPFLPEKPDDWPPCLTSLRLRLVLQLDDLAPSLPRTLKDLELYTSRSKESKPSLPARLLIQEGGTDHHLWSTLKSRLLEYRSTCHSAQQQRIERYIEAVENGQLLGLPVGLETLNIQYCSESYEFDLLIPPRVRQLTMMRQNSTFPAENFQSRFPLLPPFIERLFPETVHDSYNKWKKGANSPHSDVQM